MPQAKNAKSTRRWTNKIVSSGEADPRSLLPNPQNWRRHPHAQRLQVQERLTEADTLQHVLRPLGVGVYITGEHTCMQMRGIRSHGSMQTSALRGVFRTDPTVRAELMGLLVQNSNTHKYT